MAAALSLSERTIEGHVSRILGKLGLTSRAQVAAWAGRLGLAGRSDATPPA
jgi:non-specific serine/threonine protein kinase